MGAAGRRGAAGQLYWEGWLGAGGPAWQPRACAQLSSPASPLPHPSHRNTPPAGPKEKLDSTAVSQPAIYVASLAALEKLKAEQGEAAATAADVACGLSLGEYTALTYAGAAVGRG